MTFYRIPLVVTPSQVLSTRLGEQSCRIAVYQKDTGLYLDLSINDVPILTGRLCLDRTALVGRGLVGELYMIDTQGRDEPVYTGLVDRFWLVYSDAG